MYGDDENIPEDGSRGELMNAHSICFWSTVTRTQYPRVQLNPYRGKRATSGAVASCSLNLVVDVIVGFFQLKFSLWLGPSLFLWRFGKWFRRQSTSIKKESWKVRNPCPCDAFNAALVESLRHQDQWPAPKKGSYKVDIYKYEDNLHRGHHHHRVLCSQVNWLDSTHNSVILFLLYVRPPLEKK